MSVSASSLHRVMACPPSAVLPATSSTSDAAERGTSIHAYMRRVLSGVPHDEAIAHVSREHRATCDGISFDGITDGLARVRTEVSYALNVYTLEVRELGQNIDRRYPADLGPEWVPGTVDLEGENVDGIPIVEDFKTGQPVDPPAENAQIKFYALVAHIRSNRSAVEGRIRYVREDGRTYVDPYVFDMFELDAFAIELREAVERVNLLRGQYKRTFTVGTVHAGSHCRYCPAISSCPQKVALAWEIVPELRGLSARFKEMTPTERGAAWAKAKEIESILEVVLEGLRDCAIAEPTPLPDGRVLRACESSRMSFVQADAISLMRGLGATQSQIDACYRRTTFAVVRPGKPDKKGKAA